MVSQQEIEQFLLGEDPEKYIVDLEYDYASNKIYKVIHKHTGKFYALKEVEAKSLDDPPDQQ
jgi:hypothetical protein